MKRRILLVLFVVLTGTTAMSKTESSVEDSVSINESKIEAALADI